jgi:mono/diheme cytochrome c family protein
MTYSAALAGNLRAATAACLLALGGALGLLCGSCEALAQMRSADPQRGHELAQKACAGCHLVAPNSAVATNPDVPSFASIARRKGNTAERLVGRIIVPHPAMPDTHLTVAELRDIVAYILSLKPQPR